LFVQQNNGTKKNTRKGTYPYLSAMVCDILHDAVAKQSRAVLPSLFGPRSGVLRVFQLLLAEKKGPLKTKRHAHKPSPPNTELFHYRRGSNGRQDE
jgi:hypothetical protein